MRVISKKRLQEFWDAHPRAEKPLRAWLTIVKHKQVDWNRWADVKQLLGAGVDKVDDCVVFDIGGNKFRIVAKINYLCSLVFIRKVMTHQEYDNQSAWYEECGCQKLAPKPGASDPGPRRHWKRST